MTEQVPIDPRPEPKLPSREESLAWFNGLPSIPPERRPEIHRGIDRLHMEVFRRIRRPRSQLGGSDPMPQQ